MPRSYARGDWGVGSDLDLVVIVDRRLAGVMRDETVWFVQGGRNS